MKRLWLFKKRSSFWSEYIDDTKIIFILISILS